MRTVCCKNSPGGRGKRRIFTPDVSALEGRSWTSCLSAWPWVRAAKKEVHHNQPCLPESPCSETLQGAAARLRTQQPALLTPKGSSRAARRGYANQCDGEAENHRCFRSVGSACASLLWVSIGEHWPRTVGADEKWCQSGSAAPRTHGEATLEVKALGTHFLRRSVSH